MNNQFFYEEFFLMYLYKVRKIETITMEPLFNSIDPQLTNNVISNRWHDTSPIKKGLLSYDENKHVLEITDIGDSYIESRFASRV